MNESVTEYLLSLYKEKHTTKPGLASLNMDKRPIKIMCPLLSSVSFFFKGYQQIIVIVQITKKFEIYIFGPYQTSPRGHRPRRKQTTEEKHNMPEGMRG